MKLALLSIFLALPLLGCPTAATAPPPPPAPGYLNPADQTMGQVLAGARSFYLTIQQDSLAGKVLLSPAEKLALNDFGRTLNTAEAVYLAFHSNTATQATAQAAVDQVKLKQAALPALAGTVSK